MISKHHPRYESIKVRERLVDGHKKGITVLEGLIAHGRGEAFDYLLGEKTTGPASNAIRASAALLVLAECPVISVNGNTAVLCPQGLVELAEVCNAKLEVNLFYRSDRRARKIEETLIEHGADRVYGVSPTEVIDGIASERRMVDKEGIFKSDVVLVALEDGDRTEALVKQGKKVIAVDLNPLSRTARYATVTVVDNVIRAVPELVKEVRRLKNAQERGGRDGGDLSSDLEMMVSAFDNQKNLGESLEVMCRNIFKEYSFSEE